MSQDSLDPSLPTLLPPLSLPPPNSLLSLFSLFLDNVKKPPLSISPTRTAPSLGCSCAEIYLQSTSQERPALVALRAVSIAYSLAVLHPESEEISQDNV